MALSSGVFSVNVMRSAHALLLCSSVVLKIRPVGCWSVTSGTWRLERKLASLWKWSSTPGFSRWVQWVFIRDEKINIDQPTIVWQMDYLFFITKSTTKTHDLIHVYFLQGRHAVMMIQGMIDLISPVKDADTILLQDGVSASVSHLNL